MSFSSPPPRNGVVTPSSPTKHASYPSVPVTAHWYLCTTDARKGARRLRLFELDEPILDAYDKASSHEQASAILLRLARDVEPDFPATQRLWLDKLND